MTRYNGIQNNFNAGEITPLLRNRFDLVSYQNGLSKCLNFIPRVQGCLSRRPGTYFVKEIKNSDQTTQLVPFVFNKDQSFILEFGNQYIRFYKDRAAFEVSSTHYEIATPYLAADLFDESGIFKIRFTQSADIIYMVHPDYAPRKLLRNANDNWAIEIVDADFPPFDKINTTDTTVYASAATGSGITLTASSGIFLASDVGSDFYIETNPNIATTQWAVSVSYSANAIVRTGRNYYQTTAGGTSGNITPTHLEGTVSDGGVDWTYLHSGYGYVEITAFTSATVVTATVKSRLPDNAVGASNATKKWAFSAWSETVGYPDNVIFYKERLVYMRDILVWFSVSGDFDNFALKEGDVLADDMGINLQVLSNQYNGIRWVYPLNDLILGTQGTIHIISPNTSNQVFSASNIQSRSALGRGSLPVPPVQIDNSLVFVQRSGQNVLGLSFDVATNGYVVSDLSLVSEHLFRSGLRAMAYQERPDNILWCLRNDGKLVALTINENQEIRGWHLHELGGNAFVESIAVIPSEDGNEDDLWMIVKRTIDGSTVRYVEYMGQYFQDELTTQNAYFLDCGITYNGSSTTTITGLDHLEGETVSILVDGACHANKTVSSGEITLDRAGTVVHVGYHYNSIMTTNTIEGGGTKGTSVNKTKRINRVGVTFYETVNAKVGTTESDLTQISFRTGQHLMNKAVPLFTGLKDIVIGGSYDEESRITIVQDLPLPMTILAITPEMNTYER